MQSQPHPVLGWPVWRSVACQHRSNIKCGKSIISHKPLHQARQQVQREVGGNHRVNCLHHSSRRAWQAINKLYSWASKPSPCPLIADSIATQLISSGWFINVDKAFTKDIITKVRDLHRAPSADSTSLATSQLRRSRPLLNASNQTRQRESTRSTWISSNNRWTKPMNGSESSSPSASAHPWSPKPGTGPRLSHFQSRTSRWMILKGTVPWTRSSSLRTTSGTHFKRMKRQVLYSLTTLQLITLFGSVDSTSNSSRLYSTLISWTSYWRCSLTAASLSTPAMVNTSS